MASLVRPAGHEGIVAFVTAQVVTDKTCKRASIASFDEEDMWGRYNHKGERISRSPRRLHAAIDRC